MHKDIFSPFRDMTPEERQITQQMVNDMYNQFVMVVAKGRHMDPAVVKPLADGRIYTGTQAKALGLIDELGNYYDALNYTKRNYILVMMIVLLRMMIWKIGNSGFMDSCSLRLFFRIDLPYMGKK